MARPGSRIARVDIGVHHAVERHRRRARRQPSRRRSTGASNQGPPSANPSSRKASSAPVSANGSANTECSNLIMSSVSRSLRKKPAARVMTDTKGVTPHSLMRALFLGSTLLFAWPLAATTLLPIEDFNSQTVTLPDGTKVKAEVMMNPKDMARGMMFRDTFPEGRGDALHPQYAERITRTGCTR